VTFGFGTAVFLGFEGVLEELERGVLYVAAD